MEGKLKALARVIGLLVLAGCTYSSVSATPIQLADGSEGFRYTGRANFGYQLDEADRVMAETCAGLGKRPLIVEQGTRAVGAGAVITGGVVNVGANQQQDIIFKCR